ncbi:MAG: chorismate mutase [Oscillospiraceae bacterium]|jgi:chorismate mutase/prephenate dehydratase|nr:chorismate mutase [Oscillospiraceae bacterium]
MGREELNAVRREIDNVDERILALFKERMALSGKIAEIKREGNIGLVDEDRERAVLLKAAASVPEELAGDAASLMSALIASSKRLQISKLTGCDTVVFPEPARCDPSAAGYQGVPGAWGEIAARSLYPDCELKQYPYFEDVFEAVTPRQVGVVPIENSRTGAIGEVYDLLRRHGCYIVGQTWVGIRHCLMANPGTELADVREVLSHPEGFRQCHLYLKKFAWDKTVCTNTAVAAETVAGRSDKRSAAVGSARAAELNGLTVLVPDIMDSADNRTRFIAIAKEPWYTEESDTVSVTFSTAHRSGALCHVLEAFMAAGINLTRIESRPAPGGKYRFFTDLQANIADALPALNRAAALCEYFEVLGCYRS